jgi:hypothetical protein
MMYIILLSITLVVVLHISRWCVTLAKVTGSHFTVICHIRKCDMSHYNWSDGLMTFLCDKSHFLWYIGYAPSQMSPTDHGGWALTTVVANDRPYNGTIHCALLSCPAALQPVHSNTGKEQTIIGDPNAMAGLIPQLAWAIMTAAREFYGTISTQRDIVPPKGGAPTVAIAQLSIHTSTFKAGYRLNLTNLPNQWKRKTETPMEKCTEKSRNSSSRQSGRRQDKRRL